MRATRRLPLKIAALACLAGLAAVATIEGLHWRNHVTVADARIETDFTMMASSVNGRIEAIDVRKGDKVARGALLATMDSEVAALDAVSVEADLSKVRAEKQQVAAELAAFRQEVGDKIATLEAVLQLRARELQTLRRRRGIAQATVDRNTRLRRRDVVSKRAEDAANDRLLDVMVDLREVETGIAETKLKIAELEGQSTREAIFRSRIAVFDRQIDVLTVSLRQANERLRKMHIYAPIDGVVNEVFVNPGAYVEDGDRVLLLHDPAKLWIEAPVDETNVRHVAVGQSVKIDIDAYPYDAFRGVVAAVGQVTVGAMEGEKNVGRVTPKVPVLIDLEATDRPLWPGLRATVNIEIR